MGGPTLTTGSQTPEPALLDSMRKGRIAMDAFPHIDVGRGVWSTVLFKSELVPDRQNTPLLKDVHILIPVSMLPYKQRDFADGESSSMDPM